MVLQGLSVFDNSSLFLFSFCKLVLQAIDLFVDLSDLLLNNCEFSLLDLSLCLSGISSIFEWLDLLEDAVILDNVDDPSTQISGSS